MANARPFPAAARAISGFACYAAHQDSGVEWLGQLPAHWKLVRNKQLFTEIDDRSNSGTETLLSVSEYFGVRPRHEVLEYGQVLTRAESLVGYKHCRIGDLAMNFMLAWKKGLGFSEYSGLVSPSYAIFRPVSGSHCHYRYFHYLLRSLHAVGEFRRHSYGIIESRLRLYPEVFGRLRSPLPPISEQQAIADFLDRETAKIEVLVAKERDLMERLQERCTGFARHLVTHGLDPDAPARDSGVDWLGDVPAAWNLQRLKTIADMKSGESITSASIDAAGTYPVYGGNGIRGYTSDFTHEGKHVLVGRQGALCGNVHIALGRFWASEHAVVVTPREPNVAEWLGAVLAAMDLNRHSVAAAQPGLAVDRVRDRRVPVPTVDEQWAIVTAIQRETAKIDALVAKIAESIDLLNEYRSALISAAVTGKIDVRGNRAETASAHPSTDEIPE